ncbi:hypothetical protein TVAG_463130 [Trichomonas vaginalis G3]|uniref:Uncharacterized protein n=1 Tax=Trichomonas vaginalis (strain ATCC PRA-98 / G3) TaxID=412133 RepID=A2DM24_TRIV3|nr:ankyrin repeat domain-containing protein 61 family [Trichomonas vaginalis G3]EAY18627.1 hypothetical protein TVAG_463130 [Trichomonas vaginalis G3]KAI5491667.1 ankyrin repeat domain-containing protein 61 family [Trichomonas vaginalis G3]|eukprot:XP_001579613.1 hypothetical protein [Trichomonas vaginalis G3]
MSIIHWKKAFENFASFNQNNNQSISITINNHEYSSTIFFLSAISNKLKNDLNVETIPTNYTFTCTISDENTYKILEDLFKGKLINKVLEDSIITDLFEVAVAIECPDLIDYYYENFQLSQYTLKNFDKNITYFKHFELKDEFITFVSQNINNIGIPTLIQCCSSLGYNFAELIIKSCISQSIDCNDFVISLVENSLSYFNLILLLDESKLNEEAKIKIISFYFNSLNKDEVKNESIIAYINSFLPSLTNPRIENEKLRKESEITKEENEKLRKESETTKQENDVIRKESEINKIEIDKLKQEIEILKREIEKYNQDPNSYKIENDKLRKELDIAKREIADYKKDPNEYKEENEKVRKELETIRQENEKLRKAIYSSQQEIAILSKEAESKSRTIAGILRNLEDPNMDDEQKSEPVHVHKPVNCFPPKHQNGSNPFCKRPFGSNTFRGSNDPFY